MHDSTHSKRLRGRPRAHLVAAAVLVSVVLLAGCGGGSSSPTVASVNGTTTSIASAARTATTTTPASRTTSRSRSGSATSSRSHNATTSTSRATSGSASGDLQSQELAYAQCMRANGVPNFPDPNPGGGFDIQSGSGGIDLSSPLYKSADARCQKYMPNRGAGPTFNPQEGAQLLKIATCMRQHGIADFPDPERAPTSDGGLPRLGKPGTYSRITNFQGWLLEFRATINMQSPAYTRAAVACGAAFLNHPQR